MAQTQYRSDQPTTIQDLLNRATIAPDAPVETPAPPQPSQVTTEGAMTPQDRQKLLDILLAPDAPGPAPEVDKPNALALLFSGLGDATNAFAAGKSGNPGFKTDYMGNYVNRLNQQKADRLRYQEKKAQSETNAKQRTAQYLLSESDRAQIRADEQAGRRDLQATMLADREQARKDAKVAADAKLAQDAAQFDAQKAWDRQKIQLETAKDLSVARIHAGAAGGNKQNEYDLKTMPEIMGNISGLVDVLPTALSGGDVVNKIPSMTKDQIEGRVRRMVEGSGVSPDAKKAIYAFAERELGQALKDFDESQAKKQPVENLGPAPFSSPVDQALAGTGGILGRAASAAINPYPNRP